LFRKIPKTISTPISVANGGTGATTFTAGSVLFMGATAISQDNASLFFDDTLNNLGLGTASPLANLHTRDDTTGLQAIIETQNSTAATAPQLSLRKSRAAGANLALNDVSGNIFFEGMFNSANGDLAFVRSTYRGNGTTQVSSLLLGSAGSGAPAEVLRIHEGTFVGIGETAPTARLHVKYNSVANVHTLLDCFVTSALIGTQLVFRRARTSSADLATSDIVADIDFHAAFNSAFASVAKIQAIYTGSGTTQLGDIAFLTANAGAPAERMRIDAAGNVYIGATNTNYRLFAQTPDGSKTCGLQINTANTNITVADSFLEFLSSSGSEGNVAGTAVAGVIAFNTFTGSHWSQGDSIDKTKETVLNSERKEIERYKTTLVPGTILISTNESCEWDSRQYSTLPKCEVSAIKEDKRCYGVYGGHDRDGDIVVLALGSGVIRVCDENGPIEIGDFICTSSTPGVGMRYSGNDMRLVVAKARQNYTPGSLDIGLMAWFRSLFTFFMPKVSIGEQIIACTLMCG